MPGQDQLTQGQSEATTTNHYDETPRDEPTKRTPLPKFQLFIVLLIQFAEPVTATVIYPFVNQFVRETGITRGDERKTGYYAGVVESAFFFAEAFTVFTWGWASDRIGRRPILLLGPLGLSISMLSFGLSKSFGTMVVSRCFQGVFNGNIGVSKSVMAEVTDSTNIADAFAMMPLVWSVGATLGPILGGVLSRPATRWPETLGKIEFLRNFPYFLPCAVAAFFAFLSCAISFVGLKETLPSAIAREKQRKHKILGFAKENNSSASSNTSLLSHGDGANYGSGSEVLDGAYPEAVTPGSTDMKPPPFRDMMVPSVLIPLANYVFLTFADMSYSVLLPLMFSTSIPLGGLGFSPYEIGMTMGTWGVVNAFVQVNLLGRMIRKFGPRTMYTVGYSSIVVCLATYPVSSYFAQRAGRVDARVWAVIVVQLTSQMMIYMAYGAIHIFIVNSAPNRAALGATNGLAQTLGCVTRSLAPTVASSLFSMTLEGHLLGGKMVYIALIAFTSIGIPITFSLPKHLRPHNE